MQPLSASHSFGLDSTTEIRLEKHPGKTLIGRIEKGFDFLGYHFSPRGG